MIDVSNVSDWYALIILLSPLVLIKENGAFVIPMFQILVLGDQSAEDAPFFVHGASSVEKVILVELCPDRV